MENANEFLLYLQKCRVVNIQMYNEKVLIYLMFVYLFVGSLDMETCRVYIYRGKYL